MDALLEHVRGPVLRPEQNGFDEERSGFQTAYRHRPDVAVGAAGADDVLAAVRYAGERGLPVAVQATGHGLGAPLDGGVLISTRRMTGVRVDPRARTARIEAGVRWQQVIDAAAEHGLAPLSGSSPHVGAVGYTLGGGLGLLSREYGWAADHVRSVELVTPEGELLRVAPGSGQPGAVRDGAVVAAMEIGLVPVARLYGGALAVADEHVPAFLDAYRSWTADLPDTLTSSVALIPYPDVPVVPDGLRGRYVAQLRVAYNGHATDGERLVSPMREVAPLLRDTLDELPFTASGSIHDDPIQPHPYTGTNALLRELDPAVLQAVVELAGPQAPVPCIAQLNHLGGALARPPAVPSALPSAVEHREAGHLLRVISMLDGTGVQVPAHRKLMDAVAPWTLGRSPGFRFGPEKP